MRVATSTISDNIVRQIQALGSQQAKLQTQVATGQRLFQPEDDPAGVGRLLNLESERRQITQYTRNADRALQVSQASFAGLRGIKNISDRVGEIGTLGTGALSTESFQAYAAEADQLLEQALQLANTRFGNDYIFAGTAVDAPPFVATRDAQGKITGVAYAGNTSQTSIKLSETASVSPGTGGAANQGLADFLNQLVTLRDAMVARDSTAVAATKTPLGTSEDLLVAAMAEHGGIEMRIEINQTQQQSRGDDLEKLVSNEADADLPAVIVKLNQTQVAYQASLQSAANIMQISLLDYIN
jgi:flagellar hook-associated protein 3 FlgL